MMEIENGKEIVMDTIISEAGEVVLQLLAGSAVLFLFAAVLNVATSF